MTPELVEEINNILSKGLTKGLGNPIPGQMCVEAAMCYILGEPHSDKPSCVGEEVNKAKIVLNDCNWPSNEARAQGMKYLMVAQYGSINLDQEEFKLKLKLNSTKRILPFLIQKHFERTKDNRLLEYKVKFENLVELDDNLWKKFYSYNNNNNNNNYYYYHYNNNYNYYYYNYYKVEFLLLVSDTILQTLKQMDCEGCKWLHLVR